MEPEEDGDLGNGEAEKYIKKLEARLYELKDRFSEESYDKLLDKLVKFTQSLLEDQQTGECG